VKLPCPVGVKLAVPPGLDAPAPAVSITVTVTVVGWPTTSGFVPKVTLVEVERDVMLAVVVSYGMGS